MTRERGRRGRWAVLAAAAGLLAVGGWAALTPLPADPVIPRAQWGAGAAAALPAYAGLRADFPPDNAPADNAATSAKIRLGRLLFFDPLLSRRNDLACATCHQPELGFADGRALARGAEGAPLTRHTPTLWNAAFVTAVLWDGAAPTLEAATLRALTAPRELDAAPAELAAELRAFPEYRQLFAAAFGPGEAAISADQAARALAAFIRTLVSQASPYDRFAAGDRDALTPAQRRGLALFRSARLRCHDCHSAPTFAADEFLATGVPPWPGQTPDPGRAAVDPAAPAGAFKAPTLRNIALTAPYMHNGRFATLAEVVDFYAQGAAASLTGFTLTAQERQDLIAFLYALTDDEAWTSAPAQTPSGRPPPAAAPALALAARAARAEVERVNAPAQPVARPPRTWTVQPGESVQAAVDRARAGDTVLIPPGVYTETVVVDEPGLRIEGRPDAAGRPPVLEGAGRLAVGLDITAGGLVLAGLRLQGYTTAGVSVRLAEGVEVRGLELVDNGAAGLACERCAQVRIEQVTARGTAGAGILIGSSAAVTVTAVTAVDNAAGLRVENSVDVLVRDSELRANALGLGLFLWPHLPARVAAGLEVRDSRFLANNRPGFQSGVGLLVLGADAVTVTGNLFSGQATAGLVVRALTPAEAGGRPDVGRRPDAFAAEGNQYADNALDIVWDGAGVGNAFAAPGARTAPGLLPGPDWPAALYTLYARWLGAPPISIGPVFMP